MCEKGSYPALPLQTLGIRPDPGTQSHIQQDIMERVGRNLPDGPLRRTLDINGQGGVPHNVGFWPALLTGPTSVNYRDNFLYMYFPFDSVSCLHPYLYIDAAYPASHGEHSEG